MGITEIFDLVVDLGVVAVLVWLVAHLFRHWLPSQDAARRKDQEGYLAALNKHQAALGKQTEDAREERLKDHQAFHRSLAGMRADSRDDHASYMRSLDRQREAQKQDHGTVTGAIRALTLQVKRTNQMLRIHDASPGTLSSVADSSDENEIVG